jgi:hypothetical protein
MKKIKIFKNSDEGTEDITIEIGGDISEWHKTKFPGGITEIEASYDSQAIPLARALIKHLPQGTRRRLLWILMGIEARDSLREGSVLDKLKWED